jgi:hypothetical protein
MSNIAGHTNFEKYLKKASARDLFILGHQKGFLRDGLTFEEFMKRSKKK